MNDNLFLNHLIFHFDFLPPFLALDLLLILEEALELLLDLGRDFDLDLDLDLVLLGDTPCCSFFGCMFEVVELRNFEKVSTRVRLKL